MAWLRGEDLGSAPLVSAAKQLVWPDPGALITPPTVVTHGPAQFMLATPGAATGADGNSAVWACLIALCHAHVEPPLRVWRGDPEAGTATWLSGAPLQALLRKPNPVHTALELHFWTAWAKHLDGNAYWRKVRARSGGVVELWPISPRLLKPITYPGSSEFIDAYRYSYAPGKWEDLSPDDIVHFRIGIDDYDPRLGLSPIKRLVREIASDGAATQFTDALLRNFGIPGLVVQVPLGASLSDEQAEELKHQLEQRFGYENRGNVGVLTAGATLQQFGFSPEQLNLRALHDVPETRIAAVMGVPPIVAGLSVGLQQAQNYASLKQIREQFTEVTVIPNWRFDAARLNASLVPEFTTDEEVVTAWDLTHVRALAEDRGLLFTRLDNAVRSGWMKPNEARQEVGLPPMEGGDVPLPQRNPIGTSAPYEPQLSKERTISLKAGELTADALQALVELSAPSLAEDLQRHFDGQRRRVIRSLTEA